MSLGNSQSMDSDHDHRLSFEEFVQGHDQVFGTKTTERSTYFINSSSRLISYLIFQKLKHSLKHNKT